MPLAGWPTVTDDSGTATDGTAIDKALTDSIRDSIEDSVFSVANPNQSPAETTDEVVTARSTFTTLNDRLNDISGTGATPAATSSTLAASENVAKNPDLAGWKLGSALAPDNFTLSGAGASVARVAGLGSGPWAARITYGAASALLTQDVIPIGEWSYQASLGTEGRKVSITMRGQCSLTNQLRVSVTDGVTTTDSSYHSGSGSPEDLTVTHTISASATKLSFYASVVQAGSGDVGGFTVTFSDSPAPSWAPPPRFGHRVLDINVTPAGNVGAPATDLMKYLIAPNLLRASGVTLHILALGYTASNATSKKLDFVFGSKTLTLFSATHNNKFWIFDCYVVRTGASAQIMFASGGVSTASVALGTITAVEDDTTELTLKFVGDANANNDIVQSYMMIEAIEPSAGI